MTNPRLIVLEEEEVARLRAEADYLVSDAARQAREPEAAIGELLLTLAARYEDGFTEEDSAWAADWKNAERSELIHDAVTKLTTAFTPPTQRSDSE